MNKRLSPLLAIVALLAFSGCGSLDPTGVYGGDKILWASDLTLATSYDTIDQFLIWETAHRGTSVCPPAATQAADNIRTQAPKAFATAVAARATYVSAKTSANAGALQTALGVLHDLLAIANTWLPAQTSTLTK